MFRIETKIEGGERIQDVFTSIRQIRNIDLRGLIPLLEKVTREERDRMAREGTGSDGRPLAQVTRATRDRRVRQYGPSASGGPPLHPRRLASRTRSDWTVKVSAGKGIITVRTRFRGEGGRLVTGHASGRFARGTVRDIRSLDPKGLQRIRDTAVAWVVDRVRKNMNRGRRRR